MKLKQLIAGAMASSLLLAGCNKDDNAVRQEEGNTHVGIVISMSGNLKAEDNYNGIGKWFGKDEIKSVAVYIVDGAVVSSGQFQVGDFDVTAATDAQNIQIKPKKAIKTTAGVKKVYVLINAPEAVAGTLAKESAAEFKAAYKAALNLQQQTVAGYAVSASSTLAKVNAGKDEIMMTNVAEDDFTVAAGVSEAEAKAGTKNRARVDVKRVVARAVVTTSADTYEVKTTEGVVLGNITDVTYAVAQGESGFFLMQKADLTTPNSSWIATGTAADYPTQYAKYDYADLHTTPKRAAAKLADYTNPQGATIGAASMNGTFLLPNTHANGSYKKGNTAYILVRTIFTPKTFADGEAYTKGADFYMGANGKFYTTKANAQTAAKGGVAGQQVKKYIGGKVIYYAWVNPDDKNKPENSPVVRNNIYHVQITGFKNIGVNWNPLYPTDPDTPTPGDPTYPVNPDPKPNDPDEPENPIKPVDPLITPENWMSVEVTALPWNVHSYGIDLAI